MEGREVRPRRALEAFWRWEQAWARRTRDMVGWGWEEPGGRGVGVRRGWVERFGRWLFDLGIGTADDIGL